MKNQLHLTYQMMNFKKNKDKKMKKQLYIFLNLIFASLFISSLYGVEITSNASNEPAKTSFIISIKNLAYKTPFFAGWRTNLAQKEAAQRAIKNLLFEKAQLKTKLHAPNVDQEEKETIAATIIEINKQIHDQKVITGEKWSKTRTASCKALCAFSGVVFTIIGLIKYKNMHQTIQFLTSQSTLDQQSITTLQQQLNQDQSTAQNKDIQQIDKEKIKNLTEQIIDLSQEIEEYRKIKKIALRQAFKLLTLFPQHENELLPSYPKQ